MRNRRAALAAIALPLLLGSATPGLGQDNRLGWGLALGVFYPTNSLTRDLFGDAWLSFGLQPFSFETRNGLRIDTSLGLTSRDRNGNRLTIVQATVGISKLLGNEMDQVRPFVAARVGPAYIDYNITLGANNFSRRQLGWDANIETGVYINRNLRLSARYDWLSRFDRFNFDGLSLNVAWQFARF